MPITLKLNVFSNNAPTTEPSTSSTPGIHPTGHDNAEAGPSTPYPSTPMTSVTHPPKTTSTKSHKKKSKVNGKEGRLTAIPTRLLSSGPSTPRPNPSPSSKHASPIDTPKSEEDEDELLLLPDYGDVVHVAGPTPTPTPTSRPDDHESSPLPTPLFEKPAPRITRSKKPIKELLNKIMIELRKRDEYMLFEEPVDLDQFPDYLGIVGGEENMMDLGTMQGKVDDGEYRSMDAVESDLRKLVTAAQKFNPPGSIPYNSAGKILTYGLKNIEKFRPIVRTPSPSPERIISEKGTPVRGQSTFSAREGTAPIAVTEIPPSHYIPVEMLEYPPNSLEAISVGWNLNGGRHIWSKRQIRGREKFSGKWRHWALDGSRDFAELEDHDDWFETSKTKRNYPSGERADWMALRSSGKIWWETELGGPQGQPPIPFTPFAKPALREYRPMSPLDFMTYRSIDADKKVQARAKKVSVDVYEEDHYHPIRRKGNIKDTTFLNVFDRSLDIHPRDALREAVFTSPTGEAYQKSLNAFVQGAIKSARGPSGEVEVKTEDEKDDTVPLDEWVADHFRGGIAKNKPLQIVSQTLKDLEMVKSARTSRNAKLSSRQHDLFSIAKTEYARQALGYITSADHPLDLRGLLNEPSDFTFTGAKGRAAIKDGIEWTTKEIARLASLIQNQVEEGSKRKREEHDEMDKVDIKRIKTEDAGLASTASSPLSLPPDSPTKELENKKREAEMKQLRLELIALCKFYPLVALKKFTDEDAEKLLPAAVRGLLTHKKEEKKEDVKGVAK